MWKPSCARMAAASPHSSADIPRSLARVAFRSSVASFSHFANGGSPSCASSRRSSFFTSSSRSADEMVSPLGIGLAAIEFDINEAVFPGPIQFLLVAATGMPKAIGGPVKISNERVVLPALHLNQKPPPHQDEVSVEGHLASGQGDLF